MSRKASGVSLRPLYSAVAFAIFAFIFCASQNLFAQVPNANTGLNARSVEVIQRLSSLNTLPIEGWVYHEGDVAHGDLHVGRFRLGQGGEGSASSTGSDLASPLGRSAKIPQRIRPYQLAHLVPNARRSKWTYSADHLFQRTPRCHGRRPRANRNVRARPSRRKNPGRRQASGHGR